MRLGPNELIILLLIVLLLFGATRLPKLARGLREARDEFQKGESESADKTTETPPESPPDAT
jgi:sec-independent protein translocase protein TatA